MSGDIFAKLKFSGTRTDDVSNFFYDCSNFSLDLDEYRYIYTCDATLRKLDTSGKSAATFDFFFIFIFLWGNFIVVFVKT